MNITKLTDLWMSVKGIQVLFIINIYWLRDSWSLVYWKLRRGRSRLFISYIAMCSNFIPDPRIHLIMLCAAVNNLASETPEYWVELKQNPQYLISNQGRVKNLKSYGGKPRIIVPTLRACKYLFISIKVGNSRKTYSLNKLYNIHFQASNI